MSSSPAVDKLWDQLKALVTELEARLVGARAACKAVREERDALAFAVRHLREEREKLRARLASTEKRAEEAEGALHCLVAKAKEASPMLTREQAEQPCPMLYDLWMVPRSGSHSYAPKTTMPPTSSGDALADEAVRQAMSAPGVRPRMPDCPRCGTFDQVQAASIARTWRCRRCGSVFQRRAAPPTGEGSCGGPGRAGGPSDQELHQ